ncbi:MAG: RNA-binding protein [Acidimicrobiia bacterium]
MSGTKLYVGNLPFNTDDDDLRRHFETVGSVTSARVILDRDTQRSRGFGFVEMSNEDEAKQAQEKLDGSDLGGRSLRVNPADDKPRPRGGGGGGGGGGNYGGGRRY